MKLGSPFQAGGHRAKRAFQRAMLGLKVVLMTLEGLVGLHQSSPAAGSSTSVMSESWWVVVPSSFELDAFF